MANDSVLAGGKLMAFVPVTEPESARAFYEGVLGLELVEDEAPFALVFNANGTMLRVTPVGDHRPAAFTILGWEVDSIEGAVDRLAAVGVNFLRYAGMNDTDPRGIWNAPSGARIVWFKDPDGNVLSLTEF